MLTISKEVAHKLHNEYGIRWKDNGISKTTTKHPKYYLCENDRNLTALLKITSDEKAEKLLKEIKERNKNQKRYINEY